MYKRQPFKLTEQADRQKMMRDGTHQIMESLARLLPESYRCLLYTSDAADERSSVDLGGRRIIKKKTQVDRAARTDASKSNNACL